MGDGRCRRVAIVGVDSAVPGKWLRAVGRVGRAQRARLAAMLRSVGSSHSVCRAVMIASRPNGAENQGTPAKG